MGDIQEGKREKEVISDDFKLSEVTNVEKVMIYYSGTHKRKDLNVSFI